MQEEVSVEVYAEQEEGTKNRGKSNNPYHDNIVLV